MPFGIACLAIPSANSARAPAIACHETQMSAAIDMIARVLAVPTNLLMILLLAGVAVSVFGSRGRGVGIMVCATVLLMVCGYGPPGQFLLEKLELRFPAAPTIRPAPAGIIVLGGSTRGYAAVSTLAREFPDARIFIAGGVTPLHTKGTSEVTVIEELLTSFLVSPSRLSGDARSANTWDNARYAHQVLDPQPDQSWVLVTAAAHMPRSIGAFRAAGWKNVTAWPVEFRATGQAWHGLSPSLPQSLMKLDDAAHEWVGLLAYWITGRSSSVFPSPSIE